MNDDILKFNEIILLKKKKSKKAKMFLLENQTVPMVNALITCENVTLVTIKQMS